MRSLLCHPDPNNALIYTHATALVVIREAYLPDEGPTWICREVNKAGLPGLYSTILATAGREICTALEVCVLHLPGWSKCNLGCKEGGLRALYTPFDVPYPVAPTEMPKEAVKVHRWSLNVLLCPAGADRGF